MECIFRIYGLQTSLVLSEKGLESQSLKDLDKNNHIWFYIIKKD